ncbi:hypothetical protein BX281_6042 [Streptomyces sp. Ag82_O1-15]|nr:hypothetical protein [Streptomyces sp. Ag82_O1-15]PBC97984.1 hypothetical protein BX281_6042 [Streptomyces sp. Ag82_O1-15]
MTEIRKARHRRRGTVLVVGVPLALTAAGAMAYGTVFGLTYGGRDGKTVTVRTLADLEKYATAADPYVIVVASAITMDPVGKEIKVASDKTIIGSGTAGQIVGGGFFLGQGVHNVVFGRATAVINKSVINLKKRWDGSSAGFVTAPSTQANRKGFLITHSTVTGDVAAGSFSLGRNWHAGGDATLRPQTTVRDSTLSAAIRSNPWSDMGGFSWKNDRFAEYRNTGADAGAASGERPQLTDAQAAGQSIAGWLGDWTPTAS